MLLIPSSLPDLVKETLQHYLCLRLGGKCVPCLYWMNKLRVNPPVKGPLGGKGKPDEIEQITQRSAQEQGVDLDKLSVKEIRGLMRKNRIGIDCSGFAYQLLDAFDRSFGNSGLPGKLVLAPGGNPNIEDRFHINADYFTRPENSFLDVSIKQVQPGDMVRMIGGKHLLVILANRAQRLTYAHSSNLTRITGVHLSTIKIDDLEKGLEHQQWSELTRLGNNFGRKYFNPKEGDGVFRLKNWD